MRRALNDAEGEARAAQLFKRFGNSFPAAYRENVPARAAVADLLRLDGLALGGLALNHVVVDHAALLDPQLAGHNGRVGRTNFFAKPDPCSQHFTAPLRTR